MFQITLQNDYDKAEQALSAFVNGAAMQLRPHGVRINCISPGPTATPMMGIQPPEVHASVRDIALDGRMNEPREVAELALFVAGLSYADPVLLTDAKLGVISASLAFLLTPSKP